MRDAAHQARLRRLAQLVTDQLGIRMPDSKLRLLEGRLQRRMRQLGLASLAQYEAHLGSAAGSAELANLCDVVTTNTTSFFRESKHFEYLVEHALPSLHERSRGESTHIQVWCAGCSTGQEAYTLAIVLSEYASEHRAVTFSILATDVSTRVLAQAERAVYSEEAVAPIDVALRRRYLERSIARDKQLVRMGPELRKVVRFMKLNFMDARYPLRHKFDIIFFRNVMIYFDDVMQQRIVANQCEWLAPGGYFFISHTESLGRLTLPLTMVSHSVFRKLP